MYSCYLFLISFASVRLILFLFFIEPIFAWNIPLVSLIFMKRSPVFPTLLFSSISLLWSLRKALLSPLAILWNSAFRLSEIDNWYLDPAKISFKSRIKTFLNKQNLTAGQQETLTRRYFLKNVGRRKVVLDGSLEMQEVLRKKQSTTGKSITILLL